MERSSLKPNEFAPYYGRYINMLPETTTLDTGFQDGKTTLVQFFSSLPKMKWDYRYEEGKWTIKEVLQHLIDAERIFSYRCFRIARRDNTLLSDFDQTGYTIPSKASEKSMEKLLSEFQINRNNTIALLNSLSEEDLSHIGNVNGNPMSARAAAFSIIGHDIWHMESIKTKYL
ncbi:DinB family protein [Spongiimicrobium salis]|uniref:DinB family protein n=1 Tax=Spongiimicrobium salis TaxID=1667022 RepID=UPI00374C9FAC